jgi:hypothetical protein
MRLLSIGLVAFGLTLFVVAQERPSGVQSSVAQDTAEKDKVPKVTAEKPMSFWMEQKLNISKDILESLTRGDFEKLAAEGDKMRMLGKIEGFVRRKNENYRLQLRNFEFANLELVRMAKRHNAEGAALAFNQLTSSCVACHVLLREGVD